MVRRRTQDPAGGDPFLEEFFARIPERTANSFDDAQLLAIKQVFGARSRGHHAVDLRFSLPLLRIYTVLLIGRERRSADRRRVDRRVHPLATIGNLFATLLFLCILAVPVLLTLYAFKSGIGVNLMEDSGAHDLLDELRRQLILFLH
ncbi:MAG: hypothetical protein AB7N54_06735 [Alphaproteobacteria bacterium]